MDERTDPYDSPDYEMPSSQPMLLDEVWGAVEDRLLAARVQAAAHADADRGAAELEQSRDWDSVEGGRNVLDAPLPFVSPADNSLTC